MKTVILSHNKKVLAKDSATAAPTQLSRARNCKNKPECPLERKCLRENVVCKVTVATEMTTEFKTYDGLASNFMERYGYHQLQTPSQYSKTKQRY